MIEKAYVSGQIARSIFLDDDQLFLIKADNADKVLECTHYEKSLFFGSGAEIKVLENVSVEEIREKLLKEKACFDALYGAIGGMDKNLSEETRVLSIQRAETLVKDPEILDFVKSRLFGNPVPEEADLETTIELCIEKDFPDIKAIYIKLLHGGKIIEAILRIFGETISGFGLILEYEKIKNIFISTGMFAKLFLAIVDEKEADLFLEYLELIKSEGMSSVLVKVFTEVANKIMAEYGLNIFGKSKFGKVKSRLGKWITSTTVRYVVKKPAMGFVKEKKNPYNKE